VYPRAIENQAHKKLEEDNATGGSGGGRPARQRSRTELGDEAAQRRDAVAACAPTGRQGADSSPRHRFGEAGGRRAAD
jgi:hypothetical protein